MNWYYTVGGQTFGPFPEAELDNFFQTGTIQPDTLVWCDGMAGWEPYQKVRAVASVPTAVAGAGYSLAGGQNANAPAAVTEEHGACNVCGAVLPTWKLAKSGSGWQCGVCQANTRQSPLPSRRSASTYHGNNAGFWIRALAKVLDSVFIGVLVGVAAVVSIVSKSPLLLLVASLLPVLYYTITVGSSSTTPGKRICGLSIVTNDGYALGYWKAFCRMFAENLAVYGGALLVQLVLKQGETAAWNKQSPWWLLVIPLLFITYLIVLVNPQKRALHDYLAGTRVIKG